MSNEYGTSYHVYTILVGFFHQRKLSSLSWKQIFAKTRILRTHMGGSMSILGGPGLSQTTLDYTEFKNVCGISV